jgi:hypothetical protein
VATSPEKLYELLPAVYRERDAAEGFPLRALLGIIAGQALLVEEDIEQLYNDLFVETCEPWVIPYIGDLVSNNPLYDFSRNRAPDTAADLFRDLRGKDLRPAVAARLRADVAKTIYYRRRKGTLPMLEELARDVTGWPAHAVEFFELLGWHQHLEHLRFQSRWTDVRSVERMDRVEGPFDGASHTVDVRQINQLDGWHNIHNIGFFLWRLRSYPLKRVPARKAAGANWRYHFSPLGNRAPLFSRLRREGDEAGLATELHVPGPIRSAFFYEDLVRFYQIPLAERPDSTDLYGMFDPVTGVTLKPCPDCSFFIFFDGIAVPPGQIVCRRLDPWPAAQPTGQTIAVDVEAGRLAIGSGLALGATSLDVYYHYGFSADVGGGPYERQKWLVRTDLPNVTRLEVREGGVAPVHASLTSALTAWNSGGRKNTVITILDSRTYALPASIELINENWLVIEAANGERPLLQAQGAGLEVKAKPPAVANDPERNAEFTLSGVVLEGFVNITGDLGRFRLLHSTLVPGRALNEDGSPRTTNPSIQAGGGLPNAPINTQLRVEIAFSITGQILVPETIDGVSILDSIVEGVGGLAVSSTVGASGPPVKIERSTVIGHLSAKTLNASETIFTQSVETVRTQEGCVRFSYIAPGSRAPRRYRCQPDLAVEKAIGETLKIKPGLTAAEKAQIRNFTEGWLVPSFTARRYGQPAYAQLHLACPEEIRTGAEDGSEMGAFCHLKQPQRESNLRMRLQEYLPFGLQAGLIYIT